MKGESKKCRGFQVFRFLVFFAGLTLLGYIPYKMMAQPEAMTGLYGVLFPSASVLALAGMVLALKPSLAHRMPLVLSVPIGLLAAGWLTTGLECIPTLTRSIMTHPLGGLFAAFHMSLQHVILSLGLGTLVLAPKATYAFFRVTEDEESAASRLAPDRA